MVRGPARFASVVVAVLALNAASGAAVASSTKVDFGDISHKGLKNLGPASTGLKLSLELGMIANQQGIANAVKAASNPSSSTYGKYLSLSTLQKQVRRLVVAAQRGRRRVQALRRDGDGRRDAPARQRDDQHQERAEAVRHEVEPVRDRPENQAVALPVNTPKLGSGLNGQRRHRVGPRAVRHHSTRPPARRRRAGRAAGASGCGRGRDADAHRHDQPGLRDHDVPRGCVLDRRPVPEPDPRRLRDRPAAGRRPAGPGHTRRDPRRGADADQRRHRVPQLLRLPGDRAEDPRRLGHRADPRELAGRDDDRDGGAEALAPGPVGQGARAEPTRRARSSCSPSRCRRRRTAPRCRT